MLLFTMQIKHKSKPPSPLDPPACMKITIHTFMHGSVNVFLSYVITGVCVTLVNLLAVGQCIMVYVGVVSTYCVDLDLVAGEDGANQDATSASSRFTS